MVAVEFSNRSGVDVDGEAAATMARRVLTAEGVDEGEREAEADIRSEPEVVGRGLNEAASGPELRRVGREPELLRRNPGRGHGPRADRERVRHRRRPAQSRDRKISHAQTSRKDCAPYRDECNVIWTNVQGVQ